MLTGKKLGEALGEAMRLKGVSRSQIARDFGIKPPSTYDWTEHGRIGKQHIDGLVAYFIDVVPPSHWGIDGVLAAQQTSPYHEALTIVAESIMDKSPLALPELHALLVVLSSSGTRKDKLLVQNLADIVEKKILTVPRSRARKRGG